MTSTSSVDLERWLDAFTGPMSPDQPYREPTSAEAAAATAGLWRLLGGGDADAPLAPLGFSLVRGTDTASGRPFALAFSEPPPGERAWAAVLVDTSGPTRVVVGCPHPVFDRDTEEIGLALWRRTAGAVLLVAGAHRKAGIPEAMADPRDHPGSLFHRFAATLLGAGLPHLQLHGFADAHDFDVVVSPGPGPAGVALERVADGIEANGLTVARAWLPATPVPELDGTTNVLGAVAAASAGVFVHVEISATARATRREAILDGLVAGDVGRAGHRHGGAPIILDPASPVSVDAVLGRSFAVTVSGEVELAMAPPRPVDGSTVTVEVVAGPDPASVTFAPPTTTVVRAHLPITIPARKLGLLTVRYSARVRRWVVVAADVEE